MKKSIASPLCSAFVIPGLGQILNQQFKKGVCILASVFALFLIGVIKLYIMINSVFRGIEINAANSEIIMERLKLQDTSVLWFLLAIFLILWLYSVLDAFIAGTKIDRFEGGNHF
ncbi:MAG: hypothetical protein JXA35_05940 [Deltaproteobacteria bacterium]|nr:hypothetical protein [Deltaproteobacteria bacterium]